jgi:DNA-binding MarR family transcriptional regulator
MDIERPNLVVIVDELERRDLITRDRSEHDRRAYSLNATPAGRMLCEKAVAALKAHEERLLRGLDDEAIAVMIRTLRIIETGVREV